MPRTRRPGGDEHRGGIARPEPVHPLGRGPSSVVSRRWTASTTLPPGLAANAMRRLRRTTDRATVSSPRDGMLGEERGGGATAKGAGAGCVAARDEGLHRGVGRDGPETVEPRLPVRLGRSTTASGPAQHRRGAQALARGGLLAREQIDPWGYPTRHARPAFQRMPGGGSEPRTGGQQVLTGGASEVRRRHPRRARRGTRPPGVPVEGRPRRRLCGCTDRMPRYIPAHGAISAVHRNTYCAVGRDQGRGASSGGRTAGGGSSGEG